MNLPKVITELIKAQDNFDSLGYSKCFSETAKVFDEGKTHTGRAEIKNWIDKANQEYRITMKPIEYSEAELTLKAEISGTFPGSPILLRYNFEIENGLITSLHIFS